MSKQLHPHVETASVRGNLHRLAGMLQTSAVPFTIRDYRGTDFDRLWEIDQLCFPSGIAYTQMELFGFITRRNAITLVAEAPGSRDAPPREQAKKEAAVPQSGQQDRIAGFVVAHPARREVGRIVTLDVVPDIRQSGLGSQLMRECEQRLRLSGCRKVFLETAVTNGPAVRLYHKLGYEILETLPDYYASHSLAAFMMGKNL